MMDSPFCAGNIRLLDETILIVGGDNIGLQAGFGDGRYNVRVFTPGQSPSYVVTDTMQPYFTPDIDPNSGARWYPSMLTMIDGNVLIASGATSDSKAIFHFLLSAQNGPLFATFPLSDAHAACSMGSLLCFHFLWLSRTWICPDKHMPTQSVAMSFQLGLLFFCRWSDQPYLSSLHLQHQEGHAKPIFAPTANHRSKQSVPFYGAAAQWGYHDHLWSSHTILQVHSYSYANNIHQEELNS